MSIARTWQTESTSLEKTLELAGQIGRKLRGGEVIELVSDLGGGKTAFVRGLAKGMGSTEPVSSPSFTIGNQYQAGDITLYHFDFYRLNEPGIMRDELGDVMSDQQAVTVVEWADIVEDILPDARLTIHISTTSENSRHFHCDFAEELEYLFPLMDNT